MGGMKILDNCTVREEVSDMRSAHARAIALIEGNEAHPTEDSQRSAHQIYLGHNEIYDGPMTITDILELRRLI